MRYSVLSRFEGTFIGAAVAERLGVGYEENAKELQKYPWFGIGNQSLTRPALTSQGITLQKTIAESLIQQRIVQKNFWETQTEKPNLEGVELVLASLPLTLYLHDQKLKKKLALQEACLKLAKDESTQEIILALGYALSWTLQEKLKPRELIGQIVEQLQQDMGNAESVLAKQLSKMQPLLENHAGLERLLREVGRDGVKGQTLAVAIGFYSFLTCPEDFRLCVMRALRAGKSPRLAAVVAGVLGGAYVGVAGIPVAWTEAVNRLDLGLEEVPMRQMAGRLFAAWSGVYENQGGMIEAGRFGAIAGSELLRRR